MPPITPTRALVVLATFLFVTFLWTGGLPRDYAPSALPSVNNNALDGKPAVANILPEPLVDNAGGKPGQSDLDKQNDQSPGSADVGPELDCKQVRGADRIMIIVQTSKAETSDSLPPHLKSLLSCTPNVLLFSDHAGTVDGFPIHDALEHINSTTKAAHDEFLEYTALQSDPSHKPSLDKAKKLDKWKLLPTLFKTTTLAPSHHFYIVVQPDTTLSWTNILQWTNRLDYRIPYYIGAPHPADTKKYAQLPPAILLSYGTMQLYRTTYQDRYASEWESHVGTSCCADAVLATAMRDSCVQYTSARGLFETSSLQSLEWTPKMWCTPLVAWQLLDAGLNAAFLETQERWTREHGWERPFTHFEAFEQLVRGGVEEVREGWDNVSSDTRIERKGGGERRDDKGAGGDDVQQTAPTSASACQTACQRNEECVQWKYREGECHLGKGLRLGAKAKTDQKWTSGWVVERVTKRVEEWGKCEKVHWQLGQ